MSKEEKIFEDYPEVDCNTCHSYWTDQCDGTKVGQSRKCTAYEATRQSDLPMQIEKLEKDIKSLRLGNLLLALSVFLLALGQLLT